MFALPMKIRCNNELPTMSILTPLEEQLVSTITTFEQIGYKRSQIGLNRTIINMHAYLD